ncbi:MAG TPA: HAD family acid phosphatase [Candidatus Didemnitutus sp.]|nr:HAD family acid phosphatase [Candidatus Didemnitutus sp.]
MFLPRHARAVFGLGLALLGLASLPAAEPRNLNLLKNEIRAYIESGEYDRDIAQVVADARKWLEQRIAAEEQRPAGERHRLAAVFDIDETLLSNLPHMRKMDFGYVPSAWSQWVDTGEAPAIAPVRDLLLFARQKGMAIFILTGRFEPDRSGTEKNMHAVGISDLSGLMFKPADHGLSTEAFKTACRKKIETDGYTIALNIGDQDSDLRGGFAEKTFKLPDPFYLIP